MGSNYELIKNPHNLPFNVFIYEKGDYQTNWHKHIEIIYVLEGEFDLSVYNNNYSLKKDDLFLINSYEIHGFLNFKNNTVILILQLDPDFYNKYYKEFSNMYFEFKQLNNYTNMDYYENIKKNIANISWNFISKNEINYLPSLRESLDLVNNLIKFLKKDTFSKDNYYNNQLQKRLINIIEYINMNYEKKITLQDLADREYVSIPYLSKFFKSNMGIGFNDYLNIYRLNKSMNYLVNTNKTILEVALENGFPSGKSYNKVFKEVYKVSPYEFRKSLADKKINVVEKNYGYSDYSLSLVKEFIKDNTDLPRASINSKVFNLDINAINYGKSIINFNKTIYFDFVYDGLNSNWQHNLETIQREIGFKYIKFKGIFTKGMYFYDKNKDIYNWFNIDNLLDFFIKNNLKPFIELTYTPDEYSLNAWQNLLEQFLFHCMERYGLSQMQTWNFEISSEDRSYESAIELYTNILNRLNKKFEYLRLGILFIPAEDFEERYYLKNFKDKGLTFMSVQFSEDIYKNKKPFVKELFHNISVNMGLEAYFIKSGEISYFNDTSNYASKLVTYILENYNIDFQVPFIDNIRNTKIFNGGIGLLTYNGLKKSVYNAYYLVSKLKGKIIDNDSNHIIVKDDDIYRIMLFNYLEGLFDSTKPLKSYLNYYQEINSRGKNTEMKFNINMELDMGKYEIRTYSLNDNDGSIFDAWIKMGAPDRMTNEDVDFLKSKEKMDLKIEQSFIKNHYKIDETLKGDEVKLIEIKKTK